MEAEEAMNDDPIGEAVDRINEDSAAVTDGYIGGRRVGAFYAGLLSGAELMGRPMSVSAAVRMTETWIGDIPDWDDEDEDDE